MSVQRGDLVAGRYRLGDPLGPAWRAHDEHDDVEVVLVPSPDGTPDTTPWSGRRAILPTTGTATGDHGAWLIAAQTPSRTLSDAIAQWGALPAEQVLAIAAGAVTALSGVGPHPAMTADHILLTDDGNVLLLPMPTEEDALFDLGAALFLAAEGRSAFDPPTPEPRQPTLAGLIRGLMQQDPDHAAVLDRANAELSRLGAPLEADAGVEVGADTLMAAQVASAEAMEAAEVAEGEETHVTQPHDVPTQPMDAAELLAETSEGAEPDAAPDDDSADDELTRPVPTVAAADRLPLADDLADTSVDEELTRSVPTIAAADKAPESPTQAMDAAELLAETSDGAEPEAAAVEVPTQAMDAAQLLAETSDGDDELTRPVLTIAESDDAPQAAAIESPTQPMDAAELLAESSAGDELADTSEDAVDDELTRPVPIIVAGSGGGRLSDTAETESADVQKTQPVPHISHPVTGEEPTRPVPTIVAAADEPAPTTLEPKPASTTPIPAPTPLADTPAPLADAPAQFAAAPLPPPTQFAAPPPPPTQVADAVPPQYQQQPPPAQQPQYQQPPYPAAPPTQAAAAFTPPPPGAPNPWLQQPQQGPPPQNPWQTPGGPPPGGGWGQNPPPGQPFYPMPGPPPPPKNNTGKTVGIVVGAVAAVAAIVLVVVLATKGDGSKDNINNAADSSSHSASGATSAPSTNFATGSATSSTPSPTGTSTSADESTSSDSPSDSESSSSDAYTPPPDLTSTPFDEKVLDAFQTDKTPLTLEALVPQDFTDDKGVTYTLKAGSVQDCVQEDMSANMKDILKSNSCSKEIAASYVDNSGQYLVSVKVLPLPDHHTATVVYDDLEKESAADFGIWCPKDGPGSTACDGDYRSATIKQYREQQHRYIILSVALAVNHSESSSITPWLDAAAKKAVDAAGPMNWSGND